MTPLQTGPESAHIIVFGNEKGGSGKSTSAMHVAIALVREGYKVGTIDLDARQGTLTRYMGNRFEHIARTGRTIPSPDHMAIEKSAAEMVAEQQAEDRNFLTLALAEMGVTCDFIVIDTPGTDSYLSRLAHSYADTLVTPLNDSFIDLDVLASLDPETQEIVRPSIYTKMVMDQQSQKQLRNGRSFRWIVMRNRLSHIDARSKRDIGAVLDKMADSFGFLVTPGFGERVVFRELFLKGLTLLDLGDDPESTLTMSEVTARQEVRHLIRAIDPERYAVRREKETGDAIRDPGHLEPA